MLIGNLEQIVTLYNMLVKVEQNLFDQAPNEKWLKSYSYYIIKLISLNIQKSKKPKL